MLTLVPLDVRAAVAWHADMAAEADRLDLAHWGRSWGRAGGDHASTVARYDAFEVRRDGVAIGRLGLREERAGREDWDSLHIDSLWVAPESRGRGLGRQLVMLAESEARRRRVRALQLTVAASNAPALRVYQSLNFVELGSVRLLDLKRQLPYRPLPVAQVDADDPVVGYVGPEAGVFFVSRRRRAVRAKLICLVDADQRAASAGVYHLAPGAERTLPGLFAGLADRLRHHDVDHVFVEVREEWNAWLPPDDFPRHLQHLCRPV